MADFFKGLAGGFGTGLQLGQALRQRRQEDELAKAYAKPEEFTDYTPEQMQEIQRLQRSGAYDVQAIPGAEGAVPTLRFAPRQGIELGQGEMLAAPTEIAPQRVQRYGGQTVAGQFDPTALRGLQMREAARVLGSYGDVRGAAALEAQADEQAYQAKKRPLELKQLEGALVSQGLTIDQAKRAAEEQVNITAAREKLQQRRKEGPLTAAIISDVAGEFKLDPTKFLQAEDAVNTLEIKDLKRSLSTAALQGEEGLNKFLADKFDPDKTDNIKPMIVKAKDGSFVVTYGDRVLSEYGAHKNMMSLVGGVINMIDQNPFATLTTLSTLETQAAAREASKSTTNLANARTKGLAKDSATLAKLDAIDQQIEALTPEEAAGPKGRGLLIQRNAIAAGTNKQVTVPAAGRADRPALSESEATARAKAMVETREINPATKKPYTFNAALDVVKGTAPADPADALIAAMRKNAPAAPGATPAGQQLIGLSNAMLPPAPAPRTQPTTSQERLRGLYLGQ